MARPSVTAVPYGVVWWIFTLSAVPYGAAGRKRRGRRAIAWQTVAVSGTAGRRVALVLGQIGAYPAPIRDHPRHSAAGKRHRGRAPATGGVRAGGEGDGRRHRPVGQ